MTVTPLEGLRLPALGWTCPNCYRYYYYDYPSRVVDPDECEDCGPDATDADPPCLATPDTLGGCVIATTS